MAVKRKNKSEKVLYKRKMNGRMRLKLVGLFLTVILAFVGLAIRITYINAKSGDTYKKKVLTQSQQQYTSRIIPFKRGDILDANGTVLASSEKVYNLVLDCKVVNSNEDYIDPTIAALTRFFDVDEEDIRSRLTNDETSQSQYQVLLKEVTIDEKKAFEEYQSPEDYSGLSKEEIQERGNIQGVWFEEYYKRFYPLDSLACDVIGFTYDGTTADWGIEGYYSSLLNGTNGRQYGYVTEDDTAEQTIINPQDGNTVVSTIDVNIQKIVESKIDDMWKALCGGPDGEDGAANIGVVVENPQNGEILAMASSQPYDLNNPRDLTPFYSEEEIDLMNDEMMLECLQEIWQNFCISSAYEPGSTFKPVTIAGALEYNKVLEDNTYYCDGLEKFGKNDEVHCSVYPGEHGTLTLADALKVSCNDALMQIGAQMGASAFLKTQTGFGFGSRTGIDLPGEASGVIYTEDALGTVELATSTFGQGFTCTMIQEINAFSAVINGGYLYQPRIVKSIQSSAGAALQTNEEVVLREAVSKEVSDEVREYLGSVTERDGSGTYAKVNGYSMGGKTGTAQKLPRGNGKYLVSFVGFAPLDDPQVVVYVVVDEPNVEQQADSKYAQYIYHEIMEELLPYMNIFQDEEEVSISGKVSSFYETMDALVEKGATRALNGDSEPDTAAEPTQEGEGTEGTAEPAGGEPNEDEEPDEEQAGLDLIDDEAPEGTDDTDVPEPPKDTEKITGGNSLESEGVTNAELNLIH